MDYFTINGIRYTIDDDVPTKTILVMLRKILDSKVTVFNNNLEDTVANNGKNPNDINESLWSDLQKYIMQGFKRTSDVPSELQTPLQNEVYLMNAEVGDTSKVLLNLINNAPTTVSTKNTLQNWLTDLYNTVTSNAALPTGNQSPLQNYVYTNRNNITANALAPTSATTGTGLQRFVYTMSTDQEELGNSLNETINNLNNLSKTVTDNAAAPSGNQSPLQNYSYANRNTINANAAEATSSSSGSALQRQVYSTQTITNNVRNSTRFVGLGKFFNVSARNSISNISTSYFNSDGSVGSSSRYDYIINKSTLDVYSFTWKISIKTGAVLQFTDEPITLTVSSLNYGTVGGSIGFICLPYIEIQDANWYDIDTPFVKTENLNNFNIKFLCTGKTPCLDNNSSIKKMYLPVLRDGNRICWNFIKYTDVETNSIKLGVYGGDLNIIF